MTSFAVRIALGMGMTALAPVLAQSVSQGIIPVTEGQYLTTAAVTSAIGGGKIGNDGADGVKIISNSDNMVGLGVRGAKSHFTFSNASIALTGSGASGVSVDDNAVVVVNHATLTTSGANASPLRTQGGGVAQVYNSTLHNTGAAGTPAQLTSAEGRAYFYDSVVTSDHGDGLVTGQTNGDAYVEANRSTITAGGTGLVADSGAELVIADSRINAGGTGAAVKSGGSLSLNGDAITAKSVGIAGQGDIAIRLRGGSLSAGDDALQIQGAGGTIVLDRIKITTTKGVLLHALPDASKANGSPLTATLIGMMLPGDVIHEDPHHALTLNLIATGLKGKMVDASLSMDAGSMWVATGNSKVTLLGGTNTEQIDAKRGVVITAKRGLGNHTKPGTYHLQSGGTLTVAN